MKGEDHCMKIEHRFEQFELRRDDQSVQIYLEDGTVVAMDGSRDVFLDDSGGGSTPTVMSLTPGNVYLNLALGSKSVSRWAERSSPPPALSTP